MSRQLSVVKRQRVQKKPTDTHTHKTLVDSDKMIDIGHVKLK